MAEKLRASAIAYGAVAAGSDLSDHPQLRRWPIETPAGRAELIAPPVISEYDDHEFPAIPALGGHTEKIRAIFPSSVSFNPIYTDLSNFVSA